MLRSSEIKPLFDRFVTRDKSLLFCHFSSRQLCATYILSNAMRASKGVMCDLYFLSYDLSFVDKSLLFCQVLHCISIV